MGAYAADPKHNSNHSVVPWSAIGESYNTEDVLEVVRFLLQGEGIAYERALCDVRLALHSLSKIGIPPMTLSSGDSVARLEQAMDNYLGTRGSTFLNNASSAFEMIFRYANITAGDEILFPAICSPAALLYPLAIKATPIFVDIDPVTLTIDPTDVLRKITDRTKMVIISHIAGYPADMEALTKCAQENGLIVLEDASEAIGGIYKGHHLGTLGDYGIFDFNQHNNITSFGEGGLLVSAVPITNNQKLACHGKMDLTHVIQDRAHDKASHEREHSSCVGTNDYGTELQAIGLLCQLARYESILHIRECNTRFMNKRLSECPALNIQPLGTKDIHPTYHLYTLNIDPKKAGGDISTLKLKLADRGIATSSHFTPLYRLAIFSRLGYPIEAIKETCPVAEQLFLHQITHASIYALVNEQLEYMATSILETIEEMQREAW